MKITFIWPNIGTTQNGKSKEKPFDDRARMEPLQIAVLAALTPDDIEISMFDDRLEKIDYEHETNLVAISVEIFTAFRAYEIARKFKENGRKIIFGGIHPSIVPDEALQYADAVVIGDAEGVWAEVITDLRKRKLKQKYFSLPGIALQGILPNRNIYQYRKYLPITLIQFNRGCPHSCNFCAISLYFNKNCYHRKIDEVLREIDLCDKKLFFFVDDNIVGNHILAKKLFNALIPMNIKWVGQASLDMTDDLELMNLMKKSGCLGNVVGFEAIGSKGLNILNKRQNISGEDNYEEKIKILKDNGLFTWAAFLLGHDEETRDSILETLQFSLKHQFMFAAYNILMPYPNTFWYNKLKDENRLLYNGKWWLSEEYRFNHAAFIPKYLSADELTNLCFEIRKEWNSYSSILQRVIGLFNTISFSELVFFTKFLFLYRRESFKKQGMKLGYKK